MNNGVGTLVIDTGVGKCKIAIDFIKENKDRIFRVLITSPRENLKKNWMDELDKWGFFFDMQADTTLSALDGKYVTEGFYQYIVDGKPISIFFMNIQSCYKLIGEEFDLVVLDEAHLIFTPEYSNLLANNSFAYKIGLTATPDTKGRDKDIKVALYAKYCPIIYEFTDGEKHGIVNNTKIVVIDHFLTNDYKITGGTKKNPFLVGELQQYSYLCTQLEKGQKLMGAVGSTDFFTDASEWFWNGNGDARQAYAARTYLTAVTQRRNLLLNLNSTAHVAVNLTKELTQLPENKILVFSEMTLQIDKICKHTVHSKNKQEENDLDLLRFNNGDIKVLGSCYSLTLGLNMKSANTAIFESFQSSKTKSKQRIGRLHRLPTEEIATIYVIRVKDTQSEKWFDTIIERSKISEVRDSKQYLI